MKDIEAIKSQFEKLIEIMARLRAENGCPWDREQTYESLRQYLLEETYEVLELIDAGQYDDLKYELGDLLLQVIFQSQIAEEEGRFSIYHVLEIINQKMIHRHSNVFGEVKINSAEEQTINWERMKRKENAIRSTIDGVPDQLPALLRAFRTQSKAATVGFDWRSIEPVWEKFQEEMQELHRAIQSGNQRDVEMELGDLLFTMVNLSRFLKVNPEDALRISINKFSTRFRKLERVVRNENKSLDEMTLEEMDKIWDQIKASNRTSAETHTENHQRK